MKDKELLQKFMTLMGEMYNQEVSELRIETYFKVLGQYPDEECRKAFNDIIKTGRFFPKPVDIIERIEGGQEEKALTAWLAVKKSVPKFGVYQSVRFDDPVIHSVINTMGGWVTFSTELKIDDPFKQKEFERIYLLLSKNKNHPKHLLGQDEIDNKSKGYTSPLPTNITVRKAIPTEKREELTNE